MRMMRLSRPVIYPLALLVGSLLVVAAAVAHPDLQGDGAAQLTLIAQCAAWRAIHWAFLFGFTLALTGLVGLVGMHVGTPGEGAARAGVLVGIFAYGMWAGLVAFMVGAGGGPVAGLVCTRRRRACSDAATATSWSRLAVAASHAALPLRRLASAGSFSAATRSLEQG